MAKFRTARSYGRCMRCAQGLQAMRSNPAVGPVLATAAMRAHQAALEAATGVGEAGYDHAEWLFRQVGANCPVACLLTQQLRGCQEGAAAASGTVWALGKVADVNARVVVCTG